MIGAVQTGQIELLASAAARPVTMIVPAPTSRHAMRPQGRVAPVPTRQHCRQVACPAVHRPAEAGAERVEHHRNYRRQLGVDAVHDGMRRRGTYIARTRPKARRLG